MKEIRLTKGLFALVDDEDYEWLSQYNWHVSPTTNTVYAKRNLKITEINNPLIKSAYVMMHQQIMIKHGLMNGKPFVDHKDHNGLNNQKSNLRPCTRLQNSWNKTPQINGKSAYLGVRIRKGKEGNDLPIDEYPFQAFITVKKKKIDLGVYVTEEEAAKAYNVAAKRYFKNFANLNLIGKDLENEINKLQNRKESLLAETSNPPTYLGENPAKLAAEHELKDVNRKLSILLKTKEKVIQNLLIPSLNNKTKIKIFKEKLISEILTVDEIREIQLLPYSINLAKLINDFTVGELIKIAPVIFKSECKTEFVSPEIPISAKIIMILEKRLRANC